MNRRSFLAGLTAALFGPPIPRLPAPATLLVDTSAAARTITLPLEPPGRTLFVRFTARLAGSVERVAVNGTLRV